MKTASVRQEKVAHGGRWAALPESLTSTTASFEAVGEARMAARDSRLMRARFEMFRLDMFAIFPSGFVDRILKLVATKGN